MELLKIVGSPLMGVFTPPETEISEFKCLINKGMKYFEAEAINTNETT